MSEREALAEAERVDLCAELGKVVTQALDGIPYERDDYSDRYTWIVAGNALLDSPALARLLADAEQRAWRESRLDLAYELRESGAWSEVRMAEWVEMRAERAALATGASERVRAEEGE